MTVGNDVFNGSVRFNQAFGCFFANARNAGDIVNRIAP